MKQRLFLALPLGAEQKTRVHELQQSLQAGLKFQKWVHPDDLHLTLKFLGDTEESTVPKVCTLMQQLADDAEPFPLSLQNAGIFGKPSAPSILWIGAGSDLTSLRKLQAQTEQVLGTLSYPPEDCPYSPHITIARSYCGAAAFPKDLLFRVMHQTEAKALQWTVDRIVLYRSHLGRLPMYEAIDQFLFNTNV